MRNAAQLFQEPKPSDLAPTTNLQGYASFHRPIEEQLIQTLLTNTLGNTFYLDQKQLLADSASVHDAALAHDPDFYAKALGFARQRGFMRTQPVYGLVKLSGNKTGIDDGSHKAPSRFESTFADVIKTPNDLNDFAVIVRALRKGSDGGRRIKRVAGAWLQSHLNEYWAIKYGSQQKDGFALRDLFRFYHPKGQPSALVNYVLGKSYEGFLTQVASFEILKKAETAEQKIAAIRTGRLPHEVTTPFAGSNKEVWAAIAEQMPAFALLRNLATLERHGVIQHELVRAQLQKTFLSDRIAKAKIFPFRFLDALEKVKDSYAQDALRIGLEKCLSGAETIPGKTCVILDISGSMSGFVRMSSIFALATARRSPGSVFLTYNTEVQERSVSMVDSVLTQAERVQVTGGTDTGRPMAKLIQERRNFDQIVLISDEQQNAGTAFMDLVKEYRRRVNGGVKVFTINPAPYVRASLLDPQDPNNFFVFGLTEQSLSFIAHAVSGWGNFVKWVNNGGQGERFVTGFGGGGDAE